MSEKIRVLIVDDLPETRENVRKLLQFESDVEVVAQAGDGEQAVQLAEKHQPDVVLMDINMPGKDGISASQAITRIVPKAQIIIMSVQSEADYLRRAMLAGARDFLMKPFSGDELMAAIRRVYQSRPTIVAVQQVVSGGDAGASKASQTEGSIIGVYSPKGGSGCTTIAVNLAITLAQKGRKVVLVDGCLQFGDVGITLNMRTTKSILDLTDRVTELEADLVTSVLLDHDSGLKVLLPPAQAADAEYVTAEHLGAIVHRLSEMFEYVIVDTPSGLTEHTLTILDGATKILLVAHQSLSSLTNIKRFLDVLDQIPSFESQKITLLVNRASDKLGISVKTVSNTLKRPVVAAIMNDDMAFVQAADKGDPIVILARGKPLVEPFRKLADNLEAELSGNKISPDKSDSGKDSGKKKSFLGSLFSR